MTVAASARHARAAVDRELWRAAVTLLGSPRGPCHGDPRLLPRRRAGRRAAAAARRPLRTLPPAASAAACSSVRRRASTGRSRLPAILDDIGSAAAAAPVRRSAPGRSSRCRAARCEELLSDEDLYYLQPQKLTALQERLLSEAVAGGGLVRQRQRPRRPGRHRDRDVPDGALPAPIIEWPLLDHAGLQHDADRRADGHRPAARGCT